MNNRTTDHAKIATKRFFENPCLNSAVVYYFAIPSVKQKVLEGYNSYQQFLEEARETAPEDFVDFAKEAIEKNSMTAELYEQNVLEIFKQKITDIFYCASMYIAVSDQLIDLLEERGDKNQDLLQLVISAINDFIEAKSDEITNTVKKLMLQSQGVPEEQAEIMANDDSDDTIIPIKVKIQFIDDCCDDEKDCEAGCCCDGSCNVKCNCEDGEKCKCDGHCQCECGCNCGDCSDE